MWNELTLPESQMPLIELAIVLALSRAAFLLSDFLLGAYSHICGTFLYVAKALPHGNMRFSLNRYSQR
jgi:hypothetical protein